MPVKIGAVLAISRVPSFLGFCHHHKCGAENTVIQRIAFLHHADDGIGGLVAFQHSDGLMLVRIEFFADRIDFADIEFIQNAG